MQAELLENAPPRTLFPRASELRSLWRYRDLAVVLALRDLKLRYKQTVFGVAWVLLQPAAAMVLFSVFFGRLAGLPSDGLPYPVFVLAGLTAWTYVSGSVGAAAESLVQHRDLVTKVFFPRVLAPFAAALPGLVDIGVGLVFLAAVMAVFEVTPGWPLLTLPLWVAAALAVAFAAGLWLSALNVLYRDVRYALTFLLQLWFFASPVVFPSSLVPGAWAYLFAANPVVGVLDGFRWSLLAAPAPGADALVSLMVGTVLLVAGLLYFRSVERELADAI